MKKEKKVVTKKGDKVALLVLIPKPLYEKLARIAPAIYGMNRGSLSYVVEEALRQYLALAECTHKSTNPKHGTRVVFGQVLLKLKEYFNYIPYQVTEPILDKAIGEVRGSDPRTVKKWKDVFAKEGLIKVVGGLYPRRIFEIAVQPTQ